MIEHIYDPSSLDLTLLEGDVAVRVAPNDLRHRPARLSDVVRRLDQTSSRGGTKRMPNRRQLPGIQIPLIELDDPNFSDFAL
jgi:hypothetical protein